MLGWLSRIVSSFWGGVSGAIKAFVHTIVAGIAGVVSLVFHQVTSAWDDLASVAAELEAGAWHFGRDVWRKFSEVITYWIPHFAMTAWWWVTHTAELAAVLLWHLVHELEANAWAASRYLGEFFLALFTRRLRDVLHLLETVLAAIL